MKCVRWVVSMFTMSVLVVCWFSQSLDGGTMDEAGYNGEGKVLIPHTSWPCGMAEGIPVPEQGVLVFEANMKLDQIYDMGTTPYGHREVFIVKEGTVAGEKIKGSVMPGGLDFQLSFSNGSMEIEEIFVLRTNDGEVIIVRNGGPFSSLAPTFEVRVGSTYDWLNKGVYLSSSPGMGAGGVRLTFYESKH